jgi:hypothetical protein
MKSSTSFKIWAIIDLSGLLFKVSRFGMTTSIVRPYLISTFLSDGRVETVSIKWRRASHIIAIVISRSQSVDSYFSLLMQA